MRFGIEAGRTTEESEMVKLNPHIMKKGGKAEFVVLTMTYAEYEQMVEALEEAEDVRAIRAARRANAGETGISIDQYRRKMSA